MQLQLSKTTNYNYILIIVSKYSSGKIEATLVLLISELFCKRYDITWGCNMFRIRREFGEIIKGSYMLKFVKVFVQEAILANVQMQMWCKYGISKRGGFKTSIVHC